MNKENEMETIILTGLDTNFQSKIGKLLAQQLNWPFYDLDEEVAKLIRRLPASQLFNLSENQINQLMQHVLINLLEKREAVIAANSNIVDTHQNFHFLKNCAAVIIYLYDRFDSDKANYVATKIADDRNLGSLIVGTFHLIWELYDERYRNISDLMVEVNGKKAEKVAKEIATFISLEVGEDDFF